MIGTGSAIRGVVALTFGALIWGASAAAQPAAAGPVVVELFTSQGCSSCPPADRYLGELAAREGVLALSYHVTYWDYLGWKDRFATEEGTLRQRHYARSLKQRYVYTPEMVVHGVTHMAGTERSNIEAAMKTAPGEAPLSLDPVIEKAADGSMSVTVPDSAFDGEAEVVLMLFDDKQSTDVQAGENRGRQLDYHNVVRAIVPLGAYDGKRVTYDLPTAIAGDRDGCAVLVQVAGVGPILGAASMPIGR